MSSASGASKRRMVAGSRCPGSRAASSAVVVRLSHRTNVCSHGDRTRDRSSPPEEQSMSPARFVLTPRGDFSLPEAIRFAHGFEPLPRGDERADHGDTLRLAFCAEHEWAPVAIRARRTHAGRISVKVAGGAHTEAVRTQVERMLSLDVDARSLPDAVAQDAVAAELVRRFRGLRPVCFGSPYDAACWAVLSQRIQMTQAARIRHWMSAELGDAVEIDDGRQPGG